MENTKLPVDNAALDAAYIENEPDEFITDMTDSHNGIDTATAVWKNHIVCYLRDQLILPMPLEHVLTNFIREFTGFSRSYLQTLIQDGSVTVNGKNVKSNYKLNAGDIIAIHVPEVKEQEIAAEDIPLDILYEDEDIIVVNKPKGMVVHPAAGHTSGTLVNALMYHCKDHLSGINGELRPGIVHRIDMNTTGVLVACKNDYAHRKIAEQLSVHSITRKYEAICYNAFREETGTVDAPIGRNPVDRKKWQLTKRMADAQ